MKLSALASQFRNEFRKSHPELVRKRRNTPAVSERKVSFSFIGGNSYPYIDLIRGVSLKKYSTQHYFISVDELLLHKEHSDEIFALVSALLEKSDFRGVLELSYSYSLDDEDKKKKVFNQEFAELYEFVQSDERVRFNYKYELEIKVFPSFNSVVCELSFNPFLITVLDKSSYKPATFETFRSVNQLKEWLDRNERELEELEIFKKEAGAYILKTYHHAFEHHMHEGKVFSSTFQGESAIFHMNKNYRYDGRCEYYTFIGRNAVHFDSLQELKENTIPLWEKHLHKHLIRQLYAADEKTP